MPLFKVDNLRAQKIPSRDLDLEKNLQVIFEKNLEEILDIFFIAHEYSTSSGGRIDTLGLDYNGSPCIIEYKRNSNINVINQGISYLKWLKDHKAEFERLVQEAPSMVVNDSDNKPPVPWFVGLIADKNGKRRVLKPKIDWDSPRVICVAESYNKFDLDMADFLPINIELFRYKIYEGNILYLEREKDQKDKRSGKSLNKAAKIERLQKEYSIEDHLQKSSEGIKSLFFSLKEKILSLDQEIIEEPKKHYIAYKLGTNFVDVETRSKDIKVFLNLKSGQLDDPTGLARDLAKPKKVGHWGNGDYEIKLSDPKELSYVFDLIKQSYDLNK